MVFVLDTNRKPLDPCHSAKARKLLKQEKAKIFKRYPFTIILNESISTKAQNYRLKIDYGSRHTGLAILQQDKVVFMAQLHHRSDITELLEKRKAYRRRRRSKNLRYRPPRFVNRKRKKGWVPPSLQSRVHNIATWVNRFQKIIPLTDISYENVKFDTQLLQNPSITGVEYQQGTLMGYEVRQYLLERYHRTCAYCGKRNIPLEVEHILPKSRGGSNRLDNLTIACHDCNQRKGNQTAEEFGFPHVKGNVAFFKDSAVVNATRWKIYGILQATGLSVECGTGARTKMNRIAVGLPKDHHYDACCIGESTPPSLQLKTNQVLHIKAKGRGSHCRTNVNQFGFPRGYLMRQKTVFGFQTGDMIKAIVPKGKYKGTWYGEVACRKTGSFDIKNKDGKRIAQGINYKHCQIIQRFDGYSYQLQEAKASHSSHA
ncbi:RNA-guided endonuclease IscB (plasmid) [Aneurinibacillus sp. Ricciae_BoGa-3]|uniref:RNA-guided endonuclease IscB n=1 Tax=Aneurinibacillus sp. Ricciae_BoGa-3 TaxID=3022697 RepID=UPI00233FCA59|nr:RNA-guided endonuclease IscB [Aneurinibacillus sp. Ricciae_BoGa-3]WCK57593.1 RNA-guided endonuclease IscB [Aneurinibacillus sp. Ricciae_BoGa-3]